MTLTRAFPRLLVFSLLFTGVSAQTLTATLEWDPSPSAEVVGYHVYRRVGESGNFQRLTSSATSSRIFADSGVSYGQLYYYTATAVSSSGTESFYSNEVALDLVCRGDVNMDRQRNVLDVVQIQNHIVGSILLQDNALLAGDVDGDGLVTVLDAVRLLNHVVGNLTLPGCIG